MLPTEINIFNPFSIIVPLFISTIFLEYRSGRKRSEPMYNGKDLWANVAIGIGAAVLANLLKLFFEVMFFAFFFNLTKSVRLEVLGYESLGWYWWVWILAFFGDDFTNYWHHRWNHKIRVLWAAHAVHHSSRFFNYSTGLRNGWVAFLYKHISWIWLPMLGFEPAMITTCLVVNAVYQFFLHTQTIRRYWLPDLVFLTPELHEVHHCCNIPYLDKNYGGILIVWDRIFGTFQKPLPDLKAEFGVLKDPKSHNPFYLHVYEYLALIKDLGKSRSLKEMLLHTFGEPGWSPDGSTKTTRELQNKKP